MNTNSVLELKEVNSSEYRDFIFAKKNNQTKIEGNDILVFVGGLLIGKVTEEERNSLDKPNIKHFIAI